MQNLSVHGFHIYNMMDFIFKVNLTLKFNVNKKLYRKVQRTFIYIIKEHFQSQSRELPLKSLKLVTI